MPNPDNPSLQINFDFARRRVQHFLGYKRPYGDLNDSQKTDVDHSMETGTRWYTWPALIPMQSGDTPVMHQWSWLNVTATGLGLKADEDLSNFSHDLPADFGDILGDITYSIAGTGEQRIVQISPERLNAMRAAEPTGAELTGPPQYFAIRAKRQDNQTVSQRRELITYPTADQPYEILYRYNVIPFKLTEPEHVPLGGPMHAETWLYACLAAAEMIKNDEQRGPRWNMFMEQLTKSVALDNIAEQPTAEIHYPIREPEKTLDVQFRTLVREVGDAMGYGLDPLAYEPGQLRNAKYIVQWGLMQFYQAHKWKFLDVEREITVLNGQDKVVFANDFGGKVDRFAFKDTDGDPIPIVPEERIEALRSNDNTTGKPTYASITAVDGKTFRANFYRRPDKQYTFLFSGNVIPGPLVNDEDVPLGTAFHAQTILLSCLAVAEGKKGAAGVWSERYLGALEDSKQFDQDLKSASKISTFPPDGLSTTLEVNFNTLMAHYCREKFRTWDVNALDHEQRSSAEEGVQQGYRRVLFPVPEEDQKAHNWSFMEPVRTITIYPQYLPSVEFSTDNTIGGTVYDPVANKTTFTIAYGAGGDKIESTQAGMYLVTSKGPTSIFEILEANAPADVGDNATIVVAADPGSENGNNWGITDKPITIVATTGTLKRVTSTEKENVFFQSMEDGLEPFDFGDDVVLTITDFEDGENIIVDDPDGKISTDRAGTMTLEHGNDYFLPKEVNGINGDLTHENESTGYVPVVLTGEQLIREKRSALGLSSGHPLDAAIIPIRSEQVSQQRKKLMIWPSPDGNYNLIYRYPLTPPKLSSSTPIPYGGPNLGEVYLESVLAVAEEDRIRDGERVTPIHGPRFKDMLRAAIAQDAAGHEPERYGYNWDNSDAIHAFGGYRRNRNWYRGTLVTVGGVQPD